MTTLPLTLHRRLAMGLTRLFRPIERRGVLAELATLDDRLLRDIGLSRVDVEAMRRMW